MKATVDLDSWHLSRAWVGPDHLPDCNCPRAACGYAIPTATCPEHSLGAGKAIGNSHPPALCPGDQPSGTFQADVNALAEIISVVPDDDDADNDYDTARRILHSAWLAAHDREVREQVAREIVAFRDAPASLTEVLSMSVFSVLTRAARIARGGQA